MRPRESSPRTSSRTRTTPGRSLLWGFAITKARRPGVNHSVSLSGTLYAESLITRSYEVRVGGDVMTSERSHADVLQSLDNKLLHASTWVLSEDIFPHANYPRSLTFVRLRHHKSSTTWGQSLCVPFRDIIRWELNHPLLWSNNHFIWQKHLREKLQSREARNEKRGM